MLRLMMSSSEIPEFHPACIYASGVPFPNYYRTARYRGPER